MPNTAHPNPNPNQPPFVRVIRPRIKLETGFVLDGGGICMELLTPQVHTHMHTHMHMHGTCMAHAHAHAHAHA